MQNKQLLSPQIAQELALDSEDFLTEEALLEALTERVGWMLDHQLDLLLSLMYRMDVLEKDIQSVLGKKYISPARDLAILILERQKKKIETRQKYRSEDINWED
jgi:hypothetical protein